MVFVEEEHAVLVVVSRVELQTSEQKIDHPNCLPLPVFTGPNVCHARERAKQMRPILITSFAFVLGILPLVIATGAGAELRQSLGTAVFAGMLGVTAFGLLFTPTFYVVCRALSERLGKPATSRGGAPAPESAE